MRDRCAYHVRDAAGVGEDDEEPVAVVEAGEGRRTRRPRR